ncbi:MAG: dihydropteroate synthase [Spirochaetae bacterium HGW-Spirochaetae-9]|nr:MAG: dihydropteroate synthase [Spirochaetae bacterium HGW-Spirochaetae-9]
MKRCLSLPGSRTLELGLRPVIMGIVNVTPDSFFGESRRPDPIQAAERALALVEEGADILDFGAESTRPGSEPVSPEEEAKRLIPAIREFRKRSKALLSVDTRRADVARAALDEGADMINDIGALGAPGMADAVARSGAAIILMHMRGNPATMQSDPVYGDCAAEVRDFLLAAARRALDAGISPSSIVFDPGIGFGKLLAHNLDLLRRLSLLADCGYPVLVGLSRKRFIGELTGQPVENRLAGSLGAACAAWVQGADIFRVHDVAATRDALGVFAAARQKQKGDQWT